MAEDEDAQDTRDSRINGFPRNVHSMMFGWCFTATFAHKVGWMSRATSEGNEAKWKIKHPSDRPRARFELRLLRSVANCATKWTTESPLKCWLKYKYNVDWKYFKFPQSIKFYAKWCICIIISGSRNINKNWEIFPGTYFSEQDDHFPTNGYTTLLKYYHKVRLKIQHV